jgi:hypothetical protein
MKKIILLSLFFTSLSYSQSFVGKWSSEGETTNNYIMNLILFQNGSKITGFADYDIYDNSKFSCQIKGYIKNKIAYVRFTDGNNKIICDGRIQFDNNNTIFFKKSRGFNYVPILTYLYSSN